MPIVTSSAITVIDTTDQNQLSAYLTSNLPTIQTCTSNGQIYTPSWTSGLRIKLHAFLNQREFTDSEYEKYKDAGKIKWYVQDGDGDRVEQTQDAIRTFGVNTNALSQSKSGMLTYICEIYLDGVNKIETQLTYTLVTESKNVTFEVYVPNGTVFLNQSRTIKLETNKYYGASKITSDATFQWYKYENTNWTPISGATKDNLTVNGSDVLNIASYKCEMKYKSVTYVGVITLQDKSDTYISEIYTIGGNVFKNGVGGCAVYALVRANGKEVDPLAGPISATDPSNPKEGDYLYKIDDANDRIIKRRVNSSGEWYTLSSSTVIKDIPQKLKYIWSLLDKNGNDVNFKDGSDVKLDKVIYMSCGDINETGTLYCDVRSGSTLKITTQPVSASIEKTAKATFSVVASGSSLKYQWQWRKDESSVWMSWDVGSSIQVNGQSSGGAIRDGYQFRCRISDGSKDVIYSNIVKLTVK